MNKTEATEFLTTLSYGLTTPPRTPVLRTPDEIGLAYEDITITTEDSVQLKGWFIPADSDKLIICNHFSPGNKYGFAGHKEPFTYAGGFEVNFLPKYKALHDAGYNIIAYDMRNHGENDTVSNGLSGVGYWEWQDVIASIQYTKERRETAKMRISLQSMCMGANATLFAMYKHPEEFEHIVSWIAIQPLKGRTTIERACENLSIDPEEGVKIFEPIYNEMSGLHVEDHDIMKYIQYVRIPTFYLQVRNDMNSRAADVQWMYDNTKVEDKKIYFIEDTPWRFRGYQYFSDHPQQMIDWYNYFMK